MHVIRGRRRPASRKLCTKSGSKKIQNTKAEHKVNGIQGVWRCQKIKTSSHVNIKHVTFLF